MMDADKPKTEELLYYINYLSGHKKISLPTASGCEFLALIEIVRCEGDNNYTIFHLTNSKKLVVSKTLGEFEEMFTKYHFFRVHQSHLINLRHVKSYTKNGGLVTLSDGSLVEISRRKKLEFFRLFNF